MDFLLAMGTRKIPPALAAGCTVIVKPAANRIYVNSAFRLEISDQLAKRMAAPTVGPGDAEATQVGPL